MKRRLSAVFICILPAVFLFACGKQENEVQSFDTQDEVPALAQGTDYDIDECVKLGEYKGISVTVEGENEVGEAAVEEYLETLISYYSVCVKSSEKVVAEDSIVNVDYTGYQDNQPFDGGTAKDQNVDVAGTRYIKGFAESLIGHEVGETFRNDVTFPEAYPDEKLAGETVQFEFKINYICKPVAPDELTDDIVKVYFGVDTLDALKDQIKASLTEQNEAALQSKISSAVMNSLTNNCTVTIPEGLMNDRIDQYIGRYTSAYVSDEQTLDDYLQNYYGMTYDEFYNEQKAAVQEDLTLELICEAIAKNEGISINEDDYKTYIQNFVSGSGQYADENALYEAYGRDAKDGEEYFRKMYLCSNTISYVMDNANVTIQ